MQLLEYYSWQLTLEDGTVVNQSADGEKEQFKFDGRNENFEKIKTFKLIPKDVNSQELSEVTLEIPVGAKLIYFKRTHANTGNLFPKFQMILLGWQMNMSPDGKGKNIKSIMYIYPDGKILFTERDNPSIEKFIATLPQKNPADIKGCSGCQPKLVKAETNEQTK